MKENQSQPSRVYLVEILTELEALKSLIYQGQDVAAYRQVQKMSDKIKTIINEERKDGSD